jgi:ribose transport system substrate-binding protein
MKRASVAVMVMLIAMVGCGPQTPVPTQKPGARPSPSPQAAQPVKKDHLRIAVIPKGLSHQFWLTVKAGAEAAGKESNAEIIWQGPAKETEIDKQISIMDDMINSNVDAIVMAACDETGLIGSVKKAIDAGIPVVTIDSGVKSDLPVSFIATDNIAGAKAAARELARLIGNEGEVGLIPFVPGAATSEMREQGFKEGIAELPNVKLVSTRYCQSDVAKGMNVTQDMMTANPNLKGIFAANEAGAIGAAQAIKTAGKAGQVKLVAFDASDEEIASLKDGAVQALVVQNPFQMGYKGVKAAVDTLKGTPVEKRVDTGVTVVTMENFNQPEIQKLLYPLAK